MKKPPFSEILYWLIAAISIYETFSRWNIDRQKAYLFIGFAALSIFMALFRRHYRKKFNQRSKDK